jgi:DNA-binding winged helix-turn-helix (wHTH) protein
MDVQSRRDGQELYEFGDFTLDVLERRLTRGAQPKHLAPKTYDVLVELVRRAGRLVTKRELLDTVWPGVFVQEGILTVHVATLRKVLGDIKCSPVYIETVSRSGYRFVAERGKTAMTSEATTVRGAWRRQRGPEL